MYPAKVISVFIASPNDVERERNILKAQIQKWNDINSSNTHYVILAKGWENVYPADGHPQEVIQEQAADECDVVIGIFWSKIGSPTQKYPSGTIHEIEEARKNNKKVMLFFCTRDIPQNHDRCQFDRLQEYKKTLQENILYKEYNTEEEFANEIINCISSLMNNVMRDVPQNVYDNSKITSENFHRFAKNSVTTNSEITSTNTDQPSENEKRMLMGMWSVLNDNQARSLEFMYKNGDICFGILNDIVKSAYSSSSINLPFELDDRSSWIFVEVGDLYKDLETVENEMKLINRSSVKSDTHNLEIEYFTLTQSGYFLCQQTCSENVKEHVGKNEIDDDLPF